MSWSTTLLAQAGPWPSESAAHTSDQSESPAAESPAAESPAAEGPAAESPTTDAGESSDHGGESERATSRSAPLSEGAQRKELTGDWGGARPWLRQRGVDLQLSYLAGVWGNVHGGAQTGADYEGFAPLTLDLDFDAMFGWTGGGFFFSAYTYHGGAPSERVGLFAARTISGNEAATSVRLFEIYLKQGFWNGSLEFELGQLAADDNFFQTDAAAEFMNGTFGFFGLGRNVQVAPMFPFAAPGLYAHTLSFGGKLETHWGVYSAAVPLDESDAIGIRYDFDEGLFLMGEVRAHAELGNNHGSYALGLLETSAQMGESEGALSLGESWGAYAIVDQGIVEATRGRPGLSAFVRGYTTFPPERAVVRWYGDVGLRVQRPLPTRDDDVLAFAYSTAAFTPGFLQEVREAGGAAPSPESVVELTYLAQVTGWFSAQLDVQGIFNPLQSGRDALVLGLRTNTAL